MHMQPAAEKYNYRRKDFQNAEILAKKTISLPVHEFINNDQIKIVSSLIKKFFKS